VTGRTDPEGLPVNDTEHVGVKGTLLSDNYQDPNASTFSQAAPPAAAARDDLATELFATGNDHGIWHKTVVQGQNGGGSSAWFPIPGGGRFGTAVPPAALRRKAGVVDVFAVDGDGVVWWCVVTAGIPGSRRHPDSGLGVVGDNPPATALNRFSPVPVAAVAAGRWQLDVFAMAADGRIRQAAPGARAVKVFGICHESIWTMPKAEFEGAALAVPFCTDDAEAAAQVTRLIESTCCVPLPCGGLERAGLLEATAIFAIGVWWNGGQARRVFPAPAVASDAVDG
jgi:hypothetical protein